MHLLVWMLSVVVATLGAGIVSAQDYPSKTIRIVTSGLGGGSDFTSRQVAAGISGNLGQQVVVDNRASGIIPGQVVAQAAPDGYTLLVASSSLWLGSFLQSTPYDTARDFSPISLTSRAPNILVVHPALPVKSVKELIALAKSKPGALNYASGPTGGSVHLSAELFKNMAGLNIVRVNYKSGSMQMTDLLSGNVQVAFGSSPAVTPHVKSGRLRALAVTSAEPSPVAPGLPSVAASGVPGYELVQVDGVLGPAKVPAAIVNRLNQEIVRFLNTAEAKERFLNSGNEAGGSTPAEFATRIKSEAEKLGKLIKDAGISAEQ